MEKIYLEAPAEDFLPSMQDIVRLFFPNPAIYIDFSTPPTGRDIIIRTAINISGSITASLFLKQGTEVFTRHESSSPCTKDNRNEAKRLVRLALFQLLAQVTGKNPSPWGILTGIRPTKVVHRLFDQGLNNSKVSDKLVAEYALSAQKANLVTGVAHRQRKFLLNKSEATRLVSVYIGIPFCPTRCLYCSFPAYPLQKFKAWVDPFLKALVKEIIEVGSAIRNNGLKVQSIYFGGGTPTSISLRQLAILLETVNKYLYCTETIEVTMEGGRPDTLSYEILEICARAGVSRLSINPQTMQEKTLHTIGRNHTVQDIYKALENARKLSFPVINMDLIIGLPGEKESDVEKTMELMKPLKPDNLTIHALAVKKASLLRRELDKYTISGAGEAVRMWERTHQGAMAMGLAPYYLYRQKNIVGNLENIGYALPGKECIYNIQMIEEKQTIIGLGAGAGSKWVQPEHWLLTNRYNPKDPLMYIERIKQLIAWKEKELKSLSHNQSN